MLLDVDGCWMMLVDSKCYKILLESLRRPRMRAASSDDNSKWIKDI